MARRWVFLMVGVLFSGAVFALDESTERAVPAQPPLRQFSAPSSPATVEQQVFALQQQVQALQSQLAVLQSVLQVTQSGVTLRAPALSILADNDVRVQAGRAITVRAGADLGLQSSSNAVIKAAGAGSFEAGGTMDVKGSQLRLNGGSRPIATVGSQVQVPGQPNGQVVTGSATVSAN